MHHRSLALLLLAVPLATGFTCSSLFNRDPAPEVGGEWAITYDDEFEVEVAIGGSIYTETLGAQGGVVTITHEGTPLEFDVDCSQAEVICPSEAWPQVVTISQPRIEYPRRMWVRLPTMRCFGQLVAADPAACGPDTANPDCEDVCDGEVVYTEADTFGLIDDPGENFELWLGAGFASDGNNCAMVSVSAARAALVSEDPGTEDWMAWEMSGGEVTTAYAGGCLWAGDSNGDQELEAAISGALVTVRTGFHGTRSE